MSSGQSRREQILEQLMAHGHVSVRDLALELMVSEATIRRDLRQLADNRQADLVYGGATVPRANDDSVQSRSMRNLEAKRAIGRLAAELVNDHDMLYVDAGTTSFEMRHHLLNKHNVSVILNSTRLAMELGANPELKIIFLGGQYRPDRMDTHGPLSLNSIDQLRGYRAFIGADGLSPDFGVSANDIQTAYLYQHVVRNARETILLADHTKFQSASLYRICGFEEISRIVTDRAPSSEWSEFFAERGIEAICPPAPGQAEGITSDVKPSPLPLSLGERELDIPSKRGKDGRVVFSPDEERRIRERVRAGESKQALADELGVHRNTIDNICDRAELQPRHP